MTIQQSYPNSRPSLNLNFALSKKLDPVVTFSRTTSGTQINSSGFIESVPYDTARFDHDPETLEPRGLLIEEGRTNFCTLSGDNYSFVSTINITETDVFNPDGTPAIRRVPNATNNTVHSTPDNAAEIDISEQADGTTTTLSTSIFLRNFNTSNLRVLIGWSSYDGTNRKYFLTYPNTANQSIGTPASNNGWSASSPPKVENYGNGWYRYTFTATYTKQTGYHTISHTGEQIYSSTGQQTYTGDGVSGIYIWGRQREFGAFSTSYIPTNGAEGVRGADNAYIDGDNFSKFYNQEGGTVYSDTKINEIITSRYDRLWSITNSNLNFDGIGFSINGPGGLPGVYSSSVSISGQNMGDLDSGNLNITAFNTPRVKTAYSFGVGNSNVALNGKLPSSDGFNITSLPVCDRLLIGQPQRFQGYSCMTISQLTYYPTKLSKEFLQTLTK